MGKCCGNCNWWDKDGKDFDAGRPDGGYRVCIYVLQPGNMKERLGDIVNAHPPCGVTKPVNGPSWDEWHKKMQEAKRQIRVHAMDASDYSAVVSTRKDHYCSAWEPEK